MTTTMTTTTAMTTATTTTMTTKNASRRLTSYVSSFCSDASRQKWPLYGCIERLEALKQQSELFDAFFGAREPGKRGGGGGGRTGAWEGSAKQKPRNLDRICINGIISISFSSSLARLLIFLLLGHQTIPLVPFQKNQALVFFFGLYFLSTDPRFIGKDLFSIRMPQSQI